MLSSVSRVRWSIRDERTGPQEKEKKNCYPSLSLLEKELADAFRVLLCVIGYVPFLLGWILATKITVNLSMFRIPTYMNQASLVKRNSVINFKQTRGHSLQAIGY